jgi:soluble lytic murein transglycosylase-like protein
MKIFLVALLLMCSRFMPQHLKASYIPTQTIAAKPPVDVHAIIQAAALKHNVHPAFVKSIVAAESNFNCDAVSPKGAIGLMQLMPSTASEYGVNPSVPAENVDGGAHYLSVLLNRYHNRRNGFQCAIAAYNAGPAMVDHYRGIPPFRETRTYVARVMKFFKQFQKEG